MAERDNPFSAKTILWLIAAGLIAFAGFLILTAYAPEWKQRSNGGANAVSKSAVGFSGIYALESDLHGNAVMRVKSRDDWHAPGLLIVTLSPETDRDALKELISIRQMRQADATTTLYVLPKWITTPDLKTRGWVTKAGDIPTFSLEELVGLIGKVKIGSGDVPKGSRLHDDDEDIELDVPVPSDMHWLTEGVVPVISDGHGRVLLGRVDVEDAPDVFILADPDLLANHGLKSARGADLAMQIVDWLRPGNDSRIAFDDVTATAGANRNLLRLMFEPPFLAFTLALLVAALLTGLHAIARFGPPVIEGRAIPFGKRALADNAATLIARAGREDRLGDRYVAVVRDAVGNALGAHALAPDALETWLGTLPGGFENLAYTARNANDAVSMRSAAAALYAWKKDVTRDH